MSVLQLIPEDLAEIEPGPELARILAGIELSRFGLLLDESRARVLSEWTTELDPSTSACCVTRCASGAGTEHESG